MRPDGTCANVSDVNSFKRVITASSRTFLYGTPMQQPLALKRYYNFYVFNIMLGVTLWLLFPESGACTK